jgi:glutathione S-transferase
MLYFDGVLKKQKFVAGEVFSMADITVIGGLILAGLVKLPVHCGVRGASSLVRKDAGASQRKEPSEDVRTGRVA